jgi:hypothetical protein
MEVIETTWSGVPLLRVTGDVDHFGFLAPDDAAQDVLPIDERHLIPDLTECPYPDSGGLGVILTVLRQVRTMGWLGVIGCNHDLCCFFAVFALTAEPEFRIFASAQEAATAVAEEGT